MINFKAKTDNNGEIINSKLSPFTFPAGEAHIKLEDRREFEPTEIAVIQFDADTMHDDLFSLAMWDNCIQHTEHFRMRSLVMPYAPGARADRGAPFGAEVYAEFIGNLLLDQVIVFDPHSPVIVEELKYQVGNEVNILTVEYIASKYFQYSDYTAIIAPDKGARDRAQVFADELGLEVLTVDKERDFETGKLKSFKVPELDPEGKYLIVDDICDGGGTFLGIADALKLDPSQLDLYVSHGVFSKNAVMNLPESFGRIFTTNSYRPGRILPAQFTRFDIIRPMLDMIK